jgi:putative sterol carrier protein
MATQSPPITLDISTPEELAALLEGKSDQEVIDAARELGVDALLDKVFATMVQRFLPERARGMHATIQWNLDTPVGQRPVQLRVEGGKCSAHKGASGGARVTIGASIPVFLRVICGRVNGLQAFSHGALKVQGEQALALAQQLWFDVDMSKAKLEISTPRELRSLVQGRSDEEIETGIAVTGPDTALRQVFDGMVEHYLPNKGPKKRTVVTFSIRSADRDRLVQFAADQRCGSYHVGEREPASVTLMLHFPTFLRVVSGDLDGILALAQGKLKVRGNILTARAVQGWFDLRR